jgi:multiple sugar transport system permease protein
MSKLGRVKSPARLEPVQRSSQGRKRGRIDPETRLGLMMLAPAVIVLCAVLLYPTFVAMQSSFFRVQTVTRVETFVGLDNYRALLGDSAFWTALRRTVQWSVGAMVSQVVVGIGVALVLHKAVRGRNFVRGLVLFPYLVPAIVAVLVWRWIFSDTVGVANWLLVDVLSVRERPIPWFDPSWAMFSVVVMSLWKYLPYWALFILARLQSVPTDLYEAAQIDGAGPWQRFRYITWPWIFPVVMVLLVLRSIWAFNEFDMVYLPVQGGPLHVTTTIPVYIRRVAFEIGNIGAAAAVAMTMLVGVALLVNAYFWVYRWSERRLE